MNGVTNHVTVTNADGTMSVVNEGSTVRVDVVDGTFSPWGITNAVLTTNVGDHLVWRSNSVNNQISYWTVNTAVTAVAAGGVPEVPSFHIACWWRTNDVNTFSGGVWYKVLPTNAPVNVGYEYDPLGVWNTTTFVYTPGTSGWYRVKLFLDDITAADKVFTLGVYINTILMTNTAGNVYQNNDVPFLCAAIGYFGDASAIGTARLSDAPALGDFLLLNNSDKVEVAFAPDQGSLPSMYQGYLEIGRTGAKQ